MRLDEVLADFKAGKYAGKIASVRSVLEKEGEDAYKAAKKLLPAIAFCGEFARGHAKSNLVQYNNLLVFDIDHLGGEEMQKTHCGLSADEHILAFWVSPSGNGYKGLIRIAYQNVSSSMSLDSCYKKAFSDATAYFQEHFGIELDTNCSDYSRICYVCWDPQLYINENAQSLVVNCDGLNDEIKKSSSKRTTKEPKTKKAKAAVFKPVNIPGKNAQHDRNRVSSILKFLTKRNLSITYSYDEWLRVGFAIANTFNYDLGEKYFLAFCKLDKGKYDQAACIDKLQECYMKGNGDITLGTIVEMARKKGYKGSSEDS